MKRFAFFIFILFISSFSYASECPLIGAIRWDAWHGNDGPVGIHEESVLSSPQWFYRVPFCGKILDNKKVDIECDNPQAVEKEIEYAKKANLDYWAFLAYDPENPMMRQFHLFLENPKKDLIKFALIAQFGRWSPTNFKNRNNYLAEIIKKQKNYLKINERPIIFIFDISKWEKRMLNLWGSPENLKKQVIDDLTLRVKNITGNKPYYVLMEFDIEKAVKWYETFGFDAITSYAVHPGKKGTFEDLAKSNINYWEKLKKTEKNFIPLVMTGWDPRPRAEKPAPWQEERYIEKAKDVFFTQPTPEELAEHLRKAIRWSKKNKIPAIIIYAWNEFTEGGWIMPTLLEGDRRVKAIGKVIEEECKR